MRPPPDPRALADEVESKVAATWPSDADRARARGVLGRYGAAPHEREVDRVQLAIIKLAEGSLDELEKMAAAAKTDYRDVLMWAEYPEEASATWSVGPHLSGDQKRELARIRKRDREQYDRWRRE
jgi:hypothetical protein